MLNFALRERLREDLRLGRGHVALRVDRLELDDLLLVELEAELLVLAARLVERLHRRRPSRRCRRPRRAASRGCCSPRRRRASRGPACRPREPSRPPGPSAPRPWPPPRASRSCVAASARPSFWIASASAYLHARLREAVLLLAGGDATASSRARRAPRRCPSFSVATASASFTRAFARPSAADSACTPSARRIFARASLSAVSSSASAVIVFWRPRASRPPRSPRRPSRA